MLRSKKWSWLKAWAMQIARRRGMKKAIVALARRLAVIICRCKCHWKMTRVSINFASCFRLVEPNRDPDLGIVVQEADPGLLEG
jgi:hypothetical protein